MEIKDKNKMFPDKSKGIFNTKNPIFLNPSQTAGSMFTSNPNTIYNKKDDPKNENSIFSKKQKKQTFFNQNQSKSKTPPKQNNISDNFFGMPNRITNNQPPKNLFTKANNFQINSLVKTPLNIFKTQPKQQQRTNCFNIGQQNIPGQINQLNQMNQNKPKLTNLFQNMNVNSPNSLPDTLSQELKYTITSAFQRVQLQKMTLVKQNQILQKRVQNLQNRNKELIQIVNNLVGQKAINTTNVNGNQQQLQNNSNSNPCNNIYANQSNSNANYLNFSNQSKKLHNPLDQIKNTQNKQNQQNKNLDSNGFNTTNLNMIPSVTVNLFKQDNIAPMAFTQKIFITDDGYGIKALITFNAFYSIKFIVIQQIQNNNGCFIFNSDQIMKNPCGTTLNQIEKNNYWFLFNPNSRHNLITYDLLQDLQPKIIQALRNNSQEWINLHFNMEKWLKMSFDPLQRVVIHHPQWKSSNCEIILYNYMNFNGSNNDTRQVIRYQIQQWIKQTEIKNKQGNKNNVMYFQENTGKLHMILTD